MLMIQCSRTNERVPVKAQRSSLNVYDRQLMVLEGKEIRHLAARVPN